MKTCPKCGNKYRPDVAVCPNDGTPLAGPAAPPPAAGPPAPGGPPGSADSNGTPSTSRADVPPAKEPAPTRADWSVEAATLREKSSAGSWIFALVACLVLIGAFVLLRDRINPPAEGADDGASAEVDDGKKSKKKRRGKKRKRRRNLPAGANEADYADYDWEQDFVEDDLVFGDVLSERREEEVVYEEVEEPEPYKPTREEYQADGSYKPVASYAEPGARSNVVELDLRTGGGASPLDESQVKSVLNVRKLSPCYDRWVQKIPQMQGRVWMDFVIAPDGHVAAVEITRSQLRSRVVEACLVKRARSLRFPASQGGQRTKFDTHFDFTNR